MKKLLLPVLVALFFIACNKNEPIDMPIEKLYPVKFTTQLNFSAIDNPMRSLRSDSIYNPNDSIYFPGDSTYVPTPEDSTYYPPADSIFYRYYVYNSPLGAFVKEKSGVGNSIYDELPSGSYYIAIIGSTNGDLMNRQYQKSSGYYHSDTIDYPTPFYNTFEYIVSEDSVANLANTGSTITLDRMWGEIYVEILDRATCYLPANVNSVTFRTVGKSLSFMTSTKNANYNSGATIRTIRSVANFRQQESVNCLTSFSTNNNQVDVYLDIHFTDGTDPKSVKLASTQVKKGVRTTLRGNLGDIFQDSEGGNNNELRMQLNLSEQWINNTVNF